MKSSIAKLQLTALILFLGLSAWWLHIAVSGLQGTNKPEAELFAASYGSLALFGGIAGLYVSRKWGGFKSLVGKAIGFVSLGLLAQEFGQLSYSYLGSKMEEVPYPSFGDIGYFGSILLYSLGLIYLIKALKTKGTFTNLRSMITVVLLPLVLLVSSYIFFLRDYEADLSNKLVVFFDFGYPLGQAFYLALAILAFILSRKFLGGIMKPVIISLILALTAQYAADFTFLYTINQETWQTAGINDYMYLVSYFAMTMSLLAFGKAIDRLSTPNSPNKKTGTDEVSNHNLEQEAA